MINFLTHISDHGFGHEAGPAQELPNDNLPNHLSGHGPGHEAGPAQELPNDNLPHPYIGPWTWSPSRPRSGAPS